MAHDLIPPDQFVVDNPKIIFEQLNNPRLQRLLATEQALAKYRQELRGHKVHIIGESKLKKMASAVSPQGLIALFNKSAPSKFTFQDRIVLLVDGVQDPGNLGTMIRTADWFGINRIFVNQLCADVYNAKTIVASMGSIFRIAAERVDDLSLVVKNLQAKNYLVLAADQKGKEVKIKGQNIALIIGSEAHGIAPQLLRQADAQIAVVGAGQAESLNAAVAAGILMYNINRQLK